MFTSHIDRNIHFTALEKVVFLVNVKNTQHAFLLVEDAKQQLQRYDFRTSATPKQVIVNAISASSNQSLSDIPATLFGSNVGLPGAVSISSANIEEFKNNDLEYKAWTCNFMQARALHNLVSADLANPPRYGLSGSEAKVGPGHHNCLTWAVDKLNQAGFDEAKLHWSAYIIVAKPSTIPKPSFCAIL